MIKKIASKKEIEKQLAELIERKEYHLSQIDTAFDREFHLRVDADLEGRIKALEWILGQRSTI